MELEVLEPLTGYNRKHDLDAGTTLSCFIESFSSCLIGEPDFNCSFSRMCHSSRASLGPKMQKLQNSLCFIFCQRNWTGVRVCVSGERAGERSRRRGSLGKRVERKSLFHSVHSPTWLSWAELFRVQEVASGRGGHKVAADVQSYYESEGEQADKQKGGDQMVNNPCWRCHWEWECEGSPAGEMSWNKGLQQVSKGNSSHGESVQVAVVVVGCNYHCGK